MHLRLIHRGKPLPVLTGDGTTLNDLRHQVSSFLSVPEENVRLVANGKLLSSTDGSQPLSSLVTPSQTILVLATKPETVKAIQTAQPDRSLRPFHAEAPKYVATPRKTHQTPTEYGFGACVALPNLPESDKALKILEQLAKDRGFLAVMKRKRWKVGELREMPPEGRVGVDPVCVLGYNTNKGQQIHLRLRTDDMTGFRAMYSIRQVLAHELAHNEFSEHDDNFKELMRWIEKTAARDDWRSSGHQLSDAWVAPDFGTTGADMSATRRRDGNRLGSEGNSTGVSRLISAYDGDSLETKSVHRGEGTEREGPTNSCLHVDDEKGEIMEVRAVEDEMGNQDVQVRTTRRVGNTREMGNKSGPREKDEKRSALDEVMSLGFSRQLASLALRENRRDAVRAADWLLFQTARGQERKSGEMGEKEAETTRRVQEAVRSLGECVAAGELISTLEALHVYVGNAMRYPEVERYGRINDRNVGFQKRVGGFADAVEVLRLAGFRLEEGFWRYHSLEASRAWIAKSVVEERLIAELMKV